MILQSMNCTIAWTRYSVTNNPLFIYNFTYTLNQVFCHKQSFVYLQFYLYFEPGNLSQTNFCLFTILPILWTRYSVTNNPLFIYKFTYTLKLVFCRKQLFVYLQFYLYFEPGILSQTILCLFTILPILWNWYSVTNNPLFIYNFTYTLKLVFCHKQSFFYSQFYLYFETGILSQTILCLVTILPLLWNWFHKQSFVYLQFHLYFEADFLSQTIICLFTNLPILWNWYSVTNNPFYLQFYLYLETGIPSQTILCLFTIYLYIKTDILSQTILCLFTILPILWTWYSVTNKPLFIYNFTYTLNVVFCHKQNFVYLQFYLYFEPGIMPQTILCLFTILPILWTR